LPLKELTCERLRDEKADAKLMLRKLISEVDARRYFTDKVIDSERLSRAG
jgi:hypothetical protein